MLTRTGENEGINVRKNYLCLDCGIECVAPTYLRLHLTRCGWLRVSQQPRRQRSIALGHFCEECLSLRVRRATEREFNLSHAEKCLSSADASAGVRTREESL
jgi:hypothetical protein